MTVEPNPRAVALGRLHAHAVTMDEAVDQIVERARTGAGGFVVTPNVDHLCIAEHDAELRSAYTESFLALPDGQPLLWIARLLGTRLPEKVSGSDLVMPLFRSAARHGLRIAFLGATDDVCRRAAERVRHEVPGAEIVAWECPRFDPTERAPSATTAAIERLMEHRPELLVVALGNPKQEYVMHRYQSLYRPAVALGLGGSLDFLAGEVARAPEWMRRSGLEWTYRLAMEPGRMWRRYLVRDRAILRIVARDLRSARVGRNAPAGLRS